MPLLDPIFVAECFHFFVLEFLSIVSENRFWETICVTVRFNDSQYLISTFVYKWGNVNIFGVMIYDVNRPGVRFSAVTWTVSESIKSISRRERKHGD